jgi:hypothetical protein
LSSNRHKKGGQKWDKSWSKAGQMLVKSYPKGGLIFTEGEDFRTTQLLFFPVATLTLDGLPITQVSRSP